MTYCPNCVCADCNRNREEETRERARLSEDRRRQRKSRGFREEPVWQRCTTCGGIVGNNWDTGGCSCAYNR